MPQRGGGPSSTKGLVVRASQIMAARSASYLKRLPDAAHFGEGPACSERFSPDHPDKLRPITPSKERRHTMAMPWWRTLPETEVSPLAATSPRSKKMLARAMGLLAPVCCFAGSLKGCGLPAQNNRRRRTNSLEHVGGCGRAQGSTPERCSQDPRSPNCVQKAFAEPETKRKHASTTSPWANVLCAEQAPRSTSQLVSQVPWRKRAAP